jgi:hypothetical protein
LIHKFRAEELCVCVLQVSSLLRNELHSLRNQLDVNAVHVLATRILERQEQEAGESTILSFANKD